MHADIFHQFSWPLNHGTDITVPPFRHDCYGATDMVLTIKVLGRFSAKDNTKLDVTAYGLEQ